MFDLNKISALVAEQIEDGMAPLVTELGEIKTLLARLVEIEEERGS